MKIVVVSCLLLLACSFNSVPGGVIPPDKMMLVLYDMMRADELVNTYILRDTALKSKEQHIRMYEQVFMVHKTDKNTFYKSMDFYQRNPVVNKVLFDSLLAYTNRQQNAIYQQKFTP